VIFSARTIEADARAYCESRGLPLGDSKVVPLGADVAKLATSEPLLEDLSPDRYAVFVSTIEPRKGHALLYRVWRRLLAEGVPQATGFKLVFVGRMGWMVDKLMHDLQTDPKVRGNLLMLQNVSDETLVTLYRNAAFCLYPSLYEGYGLPVIEAFTHGKAVLASSGGALPESVDEFSPCLDPRDEDAWHRMLRQWITDPSARAPYEQAIRERYRRPTWNETAERFFHAAMEQSPAPVVSMRAPSTAPAK
jgi:glycosyltransferase involved in cell wall biosynthesis